MSRRRSVFLKEFVRDWKSVGSVTPSSSFLISRILEPVDFSKKNTVVEMGAGEGCITEKILRSMSPESKLYILEINPTFCEILSRIRDERLVILNKSAENIEDHLEGEIDYIISGVPLSTLPEPVSERVIYSASKLLGNNGQFVTYQCSLVKKALIQKYFTNVSLVFAPLNIPPAFVFCCNNRPNNSALQKRSESKWTKRRRLRSFVKKKQGVF